MPRLLKRVASIAAVTIVAFGAIVLLPGPANSAERQLETVRVEGGTITFRVAHQQGFFEKHGILIEPVDSGTGAAMIDALARGQIDIVDGGLDNGIAARAKGLDAVIVSGTSLAGQELIGRAGITSIADLRGKTIAVDSTDMQAALVLKKMLRSGGLVPERDYQLKVVGANRLRAMRENPEYVAAMLAGTQASLAKQEGYVLLGKSLDSIGPVAYHGSFVLRRWARDHADLLTRYIAAEIEAQRWILAPNNREAVLGVIRKSSMPGVTDRMIEDAYEEQVRGRGALTEDLRLDVPALQNFLRLRAEVEGTWNGSPPAASTLYDLSYRERALKLLRGR